MQKPFTITQEVSVTSVVNHWASIKFGFIGIYSLHVLLFHAVCCRLFCSWVSSTVLPRTAQRSEFCSMVQNHPFSWKNEWSEANNGLNSFSFNFRPSSPIFKHDVFLFFLFFRAVFLWRLLHLLSFSLSWSQLTLELQLQSCEDGWRPRIVDKTVTFAESRG